MKYEAGYVNPEKAPDMVNQSAQEPGHAECAQPASAVKHNADLQRFELAAGDAPLAFLTYRENSNQVIFEHTFVPDQLRGRGIAGKLARAALTEARRRGWKVAPHCSYVAGFIERNPEFKDLLSSA